MSEKPAVRLDVAIVILLVFAILLMGLGAFTLTTWIGYWVVWMGGG